ncbi:hypothetical protein [Bifidobacterium tissieri]|uniref:Histidine kinase n=1 Tax=Bifidobacterium tissieri TaxID=1630162 RepID=A0A5M9ZUQ0_9BIFI|nr:hypothetical protein [Bifidobacterium tissieri]KAA8829403.1 hypothetical protein EMO89_07805 [Bifidobacterium tissieri]KAA8831364.1 hypothetical protein EM849_07750 [Bifidobacterium tissieri]
MSFLTISALLISLIMAIELWEGGAVPAKYIYIYTVIPISLCILPLSPVLSAVIIILEFNCLMLLPNVYAMTFFWAMILAFGSIGYWKTPLWIPSLCFAITIAAEIIQKPITIPATALGIINDCIYYICAFSTGIILRQNEERIRALKERELILKEYKKKDILIQNMSTANALHDSISGNLSYIIIAVNYLLNKTKQFTESNIDSAAILEIIRDKSKESLISTRDIIHILSESRRHNKHSDELKNLSIDELNDYIWALISKKTDDLLQIGLTGHVSSSGKLLHKPNIEVQQLIISTITEVFANILRHSNNDEDYFFLITINENNINIHQGNGYSCNVESLSASSPLPKSEYGIYSLSKEIENIGGRVKYQRIDGCWLIHLNIPY